MASKTHLQLVNKTLQLLRESTTASVSGADDYTLLVAEYVNQAKERVEDAWRWRALTTELSWTCPTGQQSYDVSQAGTTPVIASDTGRFAYEKAYLLRDKQGKPQVFNATTPGNNWVLKEQNREDNILFRYVGASDTQVQVPQSFAYLGGNTPSIELTYPPPGGDIIKARFIIPQDEFSVGTEVLLVPWRPVVALAYALANDERGEELGQDGSLLFAKAESELALALSREAESDYLEMRAD